MYVWVECRADHLQTTQEIHSGIPEKNSQKCHSILEYIPQKTLQKKKQKSLCNAIYFTISANKYTRTGRNAHNRQRAHAVDKES